MGDSVIGSKGISISLNVKEKVTTTIGAREKGGREQLD
jgi:hypothetical protein